MNQEKLQDRILDQIWDKYVEVKTYIFYSSIYCERVREKQFNKFFWLVYFCFALPTFFMVLVRLNWIQSPVLILIIAIVSLLIPILLRYRDKNIVYAILGFYNQRINDLLDLNKQLEMFGDCLLRLYFEMENKKPTSQSFRTISTQYENLCLRFNDDIAKHDELTGEIDEDIQNLAQEKTKQYIFSLSTYGT